ncbi:hypothetical protein ACRYCC_35290 [Actinomadura scrupuli]|uniref:hypothetical protein n=1 Tax=Actinomadura scrupuli TaxID=559629 RepID=UPI003D978696
MEISGLPPERLDRLTALATELRPMLSEAGGMPKIQRLLAERDLQVMDAIIVTRALLGAGPGALGHAKTIVMTSPHRKTERQHHERLVDELLTAIDQLDTER